MQPLLAGADPYWIHDQHEKKQQAVFSCYTKKVPSRKDKEGKDINSDETMYMTLKLHITLINYMPYYLFEIKYLHLLFEVDVPQTKKKAAQKGRDDGSLHTQKEKTAYLNCDSLQYCNELGWQFNWRHLISLLIYRMFSDFSKQRWD